MCAEHREQTARSMNPERLCVHVSLPQSETLLPLAAAPPDVFAHSESVMTVFPATDLRFCFPKGSGRCLLTWRSLTQ